MSKLLNLRQRYLSNPIYSWFKKALPPLSQTEKAAMDAGTVWWEAELFSGEPNWKKLHCYAEPTLTEEEQDFIDNQLATLLSMLNDFDIVQQRKDLPLKVWQYLRKEKFFALIIPKEYGGLAFSALANSIIVAKISSKSLSAAVSVMVPNSLGPGELLTHYGTTEQKNYWLPRLASGEELPCFALTSANAGSDAGSIEDVGEICQGKHKGKNVIGIKLNWSKRYITLAPSATVLGLAFKLYDPNNLLGEETDLGITCALIPTKHSGVQIGERHNPLGLGFMNGPTKGENVFIPLDWVIGGKDFVGQGWKMLMECLSAGRGISLPALATSIAQLAARTSGAYAAIRQQFNAPIGTFEGVAEKLGRIGGFTYMVEAMRMLTITAIDQGEKPAIITAMTKYHTTELARIVLNDAMDIHAGRAIQLGPLNYLANHYLGMPVAITVEGANLLTRNLMIFGQGAVRCHPFVLAEMQAVSHYDETLSKKEFDTLLWQHVGYTCKNTWLALVNSLTRSFINIPPTIGETAKYYRHLARFSRALSVVSDISMLSLGGKLKQKEMLSARLGDILSQLYIASAVLKRFFDQGQQESDLPFVHYCLQHCLAKCSQSFDEIIKNFPNKFLGFSLRALLFPLGFHYAKPCDQLNIKISQILMSPSLTRDRLCHLSHFELNETCPVGLMEMALHAQHQANKALEKIAEAIKAKRLLKTDNYLDVAVQENIISEDEKALILHAQQLIDKAIQVDTFSADWFPEFEKKNEKSEKTNCRKSLN